MKTLALAVVTMTGCFTTTPNDDAEPTSLPSDAHYVEIEAPYASPQQCLAQNTQPFICQYSFSLCKDGRAGTRQGDLLYEGTYTMTGSVANITWDRYEGLMQFDVSSLTEPSAPSVHWVVDTDQLYDTLQFDNISCE